MSRVPHTGGIEVYQRRYRTFGLIISLLLLLGLAATVVAPGAGAATAYSPPAGSWSRFQSDLNAAEGLATGGGVTIALLPTGVDTSVTGLSGKVTNGPDYFGTPPGVISALPPAGTIAPVYWGLIALGVVLFVTGVMLLMRWRRSPTRSRHSSAPPPVPTFSGHPSPGQPFPGQPFPGQQYPSQQYPGQPYQPLPFREPAYPTRPNWSPLPPPPPARAPWDQAPPPPGRAPWEQAPPSPGRAPWEQAPPPPDPPESGKDWFDPR
jgi:hypothetical protein